MAILRNLQNNEETNLLALHLVGRHPSQCDMVLNNPKASRVHATISWDGEAWSIQDNSTNGTFVNATRLLPNATQPLNLNDKVYFANASAGGWEVSDIGPPKSMLVPQTAGAAVVILDNIVVLPSEESPEITLYLSPEGRWFCESEMGTSMLTDGNKVSVNGVIWRFIEAQGCAETICIASPSAALSGIKADFIVSQDEEHVSMTMTMNQQPFELGERSHHYLLLLLARKTIDDKTAGFSEQEQGWIDKDQLVQMLQLDEIHINMQIYRFRKQMAKALPDNVVLPQMVERRKGEIRFVCPHVSIVGGFQLAE